MNAWKSEKHVIKNPLHAIDDAVLAVKLSWDQVIDD
jgi:hypothetical protein